VDCRAERRAAVTEVVDDAVRAQDGRGPAGSLTEEVLDPPGVVDRVHGHHRRLVLRRQ
jgi:hypothetical protein